GPARRGRNACPAGARGAAGRRTPRCADAARGGGIVDRSLTMLRSVPMVHLRVQVPNRDAALATRAIAAAGLLHLVDIAHGHAPFDASPPGVRELYAAFRDLVHRIHAVADRLGISRAEAAGSIDGDDVADFAAERERILLGLEPI